ncbi:hypothetical protein [Nonomuraea sp. NPDC046570]|uniref:hypothetical protein n=1 Tax=Nonomuraea sp. NPDC046570 TaxID=3155255 RepID=UPI0033F11A4D
MRRITTTLGTLAAAGMLALAIPGSASAATGQLIINGQLYINPSGCYESGRWPLHVINRTNGPVVVLNAPNCNGNVEAIVHPGQSTVSEHGASVYIH